MTLQEVRSTEWQRVTSDIPVRSAVRFPVCLPLRLQTTWGEREATTQDVSATGLLFYGHALPPVNSKVEFTMRMPGAIMGTEKDVLIHCIGRIVRHQCRAADDLAAAVIDEYFVKA